MRQEPISKLRDFADVLPAPPRFAETCSTFSIQVVDSTPLHASAEFRDHALGLYVRGRHRISRQIAGRSVKGWTDPGALNLCPAGFRSTFDASGSSRGIVVLLPVAFFSRVITEDWEIDAKQVEVIPQFLVRDPVIEGITTRLAWEVQNSSPSGRLYAESACEFLARHIICSYSSLSTPPSRISGGLRGGRLRLVVDFIHDNLARPITLWELADVAGVSKCATSSAPSARLRVFPRMPTFYRHDSRLRASCSSVNPYFAFRKLLSRLGFSSSSHLRFGILSSDRIVALRVSKIARPRPLTRYAGMRDWPCQIARLRAPKSRQSNKAAVSAAV